MTKAVCLHCGLIGRGAMTPCSSCSYRPDSAYEIGWAIVQSDHHRPESTLERISEQHKKRYEEQKPAFMRHSAEEEKLILSYFEAFDSRDMLTLTRNAKNSIFRKQLNFHFVGPDGYEAKTVERKKDISKQKFDAIRSVCGDDVFLVNSYLDGELRSAQVPKNIWYAMRDKMVLIDKFHTAPDKILQVLFAQAMDFTKSYLSNHGVDLP